MLQLTETENKRMIGITRISEIKGKYFHNRSSENISQETFDNSPESLRKTICMYAGLKSRHVTMTFSELSLSERVKVVDALNALIDFVNSLPPFISNDDCTLNINN
ncbi:TPA: hypothetical protein PXR14_003846 [Yersinia enterocolitica]|nr:hypothetical protein [Yersinia enterocolitica]